MALDAAKDLGTSFMGRTPSHGKAYQPRALCHLVKHLAGWLAVEAAVVDSSRLRNFVSLLFGKEIPLISGFPSQLHLSPSLY